MYNRETYLNKLISHKDNRFIKVITGVRRCGKSFILKQYKDYLLSSGIQNNHVCYLNLESFDNMFIKDFDTLNNIIRSSFGNLLNSTERIYLLLDEIQLIPKWEKIINALNTKTNIDIVITGSNSFMLSSELATHITGRYVEINLFPLSFIEFMQFKEIEITNASEMHLNEYLNYGGFPSTVLTKNQDIKLDFLNALWDSLIIKDIATRINVNDIKILEQIVMYVFDTTANPISILNIVNYIKSNGWAISHESVSRYIKALEDAYIIYPLIRYDIKGKSLLKTGGKYFVVDTGIRNIRLGRKSGNIGSLLENIVYFELRRREYQVYLGKRDKYEIDFVAQKDSKTVYIQVCMSMIDDNTRDREFRSLQIIKDDYPKIILSLDKLDFSAEGIIHINLIDFLLNRDAF